MLSIDHKSRVVDILCLDFQKAFDKVLHKRLMTNVRSLGIIDEVGYRIEGWPSNKADNNSTVNSRTVTEQIGEW